MPNILVDNGSLNTLMLLSFCSVFVSKQIILLSLVRTKSVGHLRDVRRLVVALSRARMGLYVFCRLNLFQHQHELKPAMDQFTAGGRPSKLQLVLGETYQNMERLVSSSASIAETGDAEGRAEDKAFQVEDVSHLGAIVHQMQEDLIAGAVPPETMAYP